ncbi:unnamed protein product [Mycena citricolor]|uniref:Arrestin-like N-terminal domain-containing protein n=1 Tax=Mycena citricolor TaxID=2018698 RepID=A0AAD2JWN5_9AGAR|nr:unnamed protein product [Mycena citricolor]
MHTPESLSLHFPDFVRISGEVLQGVVDIDVPLALEDKIEDVKVKVRGSILTKFLERETEWKGGEARAESHLKTQTLEVVRLDQTLWDQSNANGSGVLSCPFQFQLPPNLPPSFHYDHKNRTVAISYAIEVVGHRRGLLHSNRRVRKIFSVLPAGNAWEINSAATLKQGWQGPWKPLELTKEIRHGILFGEYSEATIQFLLPELNSLPTGVPIPFAFHVWTRTKPVHHKALEEKGDKLFPAPPTSPADVEFTLALKGHLSVHGQREHMEQDYEIKGSLGDEESVDAIRTIRDEPEWIPLPDHDDKGSWKRGVHFDGRFTITMPPSFAAATVEWNYFLRVKYDFPGPGNILELELPLQINSGFACPPLPMAPWEADTPYTYPLPEGPPPMMTLPAQVPAYWSGEHQNWSEDD